MKTLKSVPIKKLHDWHPCDEDDALARAAVLSQRYRRTRWTALEVLSLQELSPYDRLWVVLRPEMLPERVLRLLAADFIERAIYRLTSNHGIHLEARLLARLHQARRFARGEIGIQRLAFERSKNSLDRFRQLVHRDLRAQVHRILGPNVCDTANIGLQMLLLLQSFDCSKREQDTEARAQVDMVLVRTIEEIERVGW